MRSDKKYNRGKKDYQRRPSFRQPRKSFLIVVEGQTEELYLKKFKIDFRSKLIDIHIVNPGCTDPMNLVNRAMELKKQREREAKREFVVPYDREDGVWVVYDLEAPNHIRRTQSPVAKQRADANNIRIATSDPAFEYWYILHFEQTTKSFDDAVKTEEHLITHWPDYRKATTPPQDIYDKTDDAIKNAQWARNHLRTSGDDAKTDVDILVLLLRENSQNH